MNTSYNRIAGQSVEKEMMPAKDGRYHEQLQLGFDGFGNFVVARETLEFFDLFAIAGNEEAGRIAEEAAEFIGDLVAAEDDGVVHRKLLAVEILKSDFGSGLARGDICPGCVVGWNLGCHARDLVCEISTGNEHEYGG